MKNTLDQYRQTGALAEVSVASPWRVIQMLLENALDRVAMARGAMKQGNISKKGEHISKAMTIIEGLRAVLDHEKGGELAGRLDDLYEYISRQLLQANVNDDPILLDEVSDLIREIKSGWDAIPEEQRAHPASQ